MPTLLDLITECLTDIGELGQGETPSPEDSSYCMGKANELLDSWSTERLNIYEIQEIQLALTAKQTFTIGIGATDFNQTRPVKIEGATILVPIGATGVNISSPMEIIGEARWRAIADLSATTNAPELLYPDQASPIMNLNLYPAPKCVVTTILQLSAWLPLQQFVALTDEFSMPTGFQKAFVDGLKVVIMASYGHPVDQVTAAMEQSSKSRIQQLNAQLPNLGISDGIPQATPAQ
ncbi:MAG: hypothetical protein ACLGXA_20495 [Acidobacteriota bacterium]